VAWKKPNCFHYSHSQPRSHHNIVCLVEPTLGKGRWHLSAPCTIPTAKPESFLDVLHSWGNTWLWENLQVMGGISWLHHSIADRLLIAVTNGSYIRERFPNLCSAAFVLECSNGRGQIVGSFSEALLVANAYRGELLGLMAIHLILLSVNKLHKDLAGSTEIVSDCLGALKRVTYLPHNIRSHQNAGTPISLRRSWCIAGGFPSPRTTHTWWPTKTTKSPLLTSAERCN
jgi:hypothetical protein